MRARKPGEQDDGPATGGPDADGPYDERKGGIRTFGENPAPGAKNEGAQSAGLSVRQEAEKPGPEGDLPGPGGAPTAPVTEVHAQR